MTVVNTDSCIFCGSTLEAHHQCVCAACVARFKPGHTQEYAETRLRYHLSQVDTAHCIVCGDPMGASRGSVCRWCMEKIVEAEVKPHV